MDLGGGPADDQETGKRAIDRSEAHMQGKIEFDGENYFVTIPQELLHLAGIAIGDEVCVCVENDGTLTIQRPEQQSPHEQADEG